MSNIPPPCDTNIFENGSLVMVTAGIPSVQLEPWVKKIAAKSGQPVDWHFAGGRAQILALGDLQQVYNAVNELLPEHDELQRLAHEESFSGMTFPIKFKPCRQICF